MEGEEVVKRKKKMEGDEKEVVKRMKIMEGEEEGSKDLDDKDSGEEGSEQPQGKKDLDDKDSDIVRSLEALMARANQRLIRYESELAALIEESWKEDGDREQYYLAPGQPISSLPLDIQKLIWG